MVEEDCRVVAVILAAGLSRRLGRAKQTLAWGNVTLVRHVVQTAESAGLPTVLVEAPSLAREFTGAGVRVVNEEADRGLAGSLQLGIDAVAHRFPGFGAAVLLADQPFVTTEDIRTALRHYADRAPSLHAVRPVYDGVAGHPVVFDPSWFALVRQLTGDAGVGRLFGVRADAGVYAVTVGGRVSPAFDIDTEEDYRQASEAAAGGLRREAHELWKPRRG